jgi:hypothetical protein
MATLEPSSSMLTLSIAGILASSPLGVSVETIALGTCFAVVGCVGRFAFDLQKALESGEKIMLRQALSWIGAGFLGAPFVAVAWIALLRTIGAQTDLATVLGLLFLGFSGSKGVTWLIGLITGFLQQRAGLQKGAPETKP